YSAGQRFPVTQHAPFFKGTAVVHGEFKELSLDDFKGKYLVLFFYPLDFTFVCPTEIVAFSNKANEFRDVNCEVVAVSVDSHFCHLAWINTPRKSTGVLSMTGLGCLRIHGFSLVMWEGGEFAQFNVV
uniref:Thioredoxin-dependent peroxide reductase, mitochondrial n=1 Tax=Anas platyrhynchos TaxID=8839 RepID=A0A8B9SKL4_ANAPL